MKCIGKVLLILLFSVAFLAPLSYAVILEKEAEKEEKPKLYCPVTRISDNDKCMTCHAMRVNEKGETFFGIKPAKRKDNYNLSYGVELMIWQGEWVLFYENTGTDSDKIEWVARFMYEHPEFKHFVMEMNSFGGSVMDAWRTVGILEEMRDHGIAITTICYGKIASAGTIIFTAGDPGRRFINRNAEVMIHKVWTFAMFDLKDPDTSQDQTDLLNHLQGNINDFLVIRTKLTHDIIEKNCFKRDWWMTGEEAYLFGIADRIVGEKPIPLR